MNKKRVLKQLFHLVDKANSSNGRKKIHADISKKIKAAQGAKAFIDKIKCLYSYYKDPMTSKGKKGLIGAALLYFIIPFDIVHDYIPILGYIDDGVAIAYVWSLIEKELKNYREKGYVIDISADSKRIDDEER